MEELVPLLESVDLTPLLDSLAAVQLFQQEQTAAVLVLVGVVLGCTISLILAVMFK